mmetsp:Transcript_29100/g.67492  ORF Transcript_29100/g.67492 Transcript_29100/m.67492 type:complete len:233 (+) Transcript_29100:90-788(+)|eukprot:CAMPEP_0114544218 /NCGR_PEP_ID=MMETSP0114-20121206/2760_1 /TAXON_ID=31324 /ORGANISM="Goniomonas sp, Strain m" /LENGTH=232 /DNA_ID=CAMNT_0001728585 /DNA_START=72 /DNA_END=770 /DNA_ORIENTATION=+
MYQNDSEDENLEEGTELYGMGPDRERQTQPSGSSQIPGAPTMMYDPDALPAGAPGRTPYWRVGICEWWRHAEYCFPILCLPCFRLGLTAGRARIPNWTFAKVFGVFLVLYILASLKGPHHAHFAVVSQAAEAGMPKTEEIVEEPAPPGPIWYMTRIMAVIIATCRMVMRWKIREHYDIPGDKMEDCLLHCFCGPCAMAQEAIHVDLEELGVAEGCDLSVPPTTYSHFPGESG